MPPEEITGEAKRIARVYRPKESEWANLTVEAIEDHSFNSEFVTEGKVQINEDRSTPIFSPYAGRVTRLFAKPGEVIQRGQPLFVVEATDMVQAQNDFIAAVAALETAQSQLNLAQIIEKQNETTLKLAVCLDRNTEAMSECAFELRRFQEGACRTGQ